jgi:hypothetical protein
MRQEPPVRTVNRTKEQPRTSWPCRYDRSSLTVVHPMVGETEHASHTEIRTLPKRPVSPPRSSNRTCGFPASGFPTGFMTGSRHGAFPSQVSQSRHTKIAEHRFHAERPDASRRHLVTPDQEVTHAVIQMGLDNAIRDVVGSRAEVTAPSPQQAVQRAAHLGPWPFVARHQDRTQFVL